MKLCTSQYFFVVEPLARGLTGRISEKLVKEKHKYGPYLIGGILRKSLSGLIKEPRKIGGILLEVSYWRKIGTRVKAY